MIRRFWIIFSAEFKAWRHDPISALGGILPSTLILIAFGLLFGGRLTFRVAFVNHDTGNYGDMLRASFDEAISPLNGNPYYDVLDLPESEAMNEYRSFHIDGVWIIPPDFSERLLSGKEPEIDMLFNNYNDDRAKNHRIYSAEILWHFYEKIGQPGPPLELAEEYPRQEMVGWFPIIAVGIIMLSASLGSMVNIFMLTHKEQVSKITIEFGLAPQSLLLVLLPKTLLAIIMGLLTSVVIMLFCFLWIGIWPGKYLLAVFLLEGLVAVFWVSLALFTGLRVRHYMAGMITLLLTGIMVFFFAGGLSTVRTNISKVPWFSRLFPNLYAADPMRDMILFHSFPADWTRTVLILLAFSVISIAFSYYFASRQLRRLG